jgi:hypothetical protein
MAREVRHVDVSSIPELLRLVEEAQARDEPCVLRRGNEDIAVLLPVKQGAVKRAPRGRVLTREDPLFDLIGIGASDIPGGVSGKTHEFLLDAYRLHHT